MPQHFVLQPAVTLPANVASGDPLNTSLTKLAGGGFVAVWPSNSFGASDVMCEIFDANGVATGPAFVIDTVADAERPSVAGLSGGDFVVVWRAGGNIVAQRFDAAGHAEGAQSIVDTDTRSVSRPLVAGLADGGFVVEWADSLIAGRAMSWRINTQLFDATGVKVGGEMGTSGSDKPDATSLTGLIGGGFAIASDPNTFFPSLSIDSYASGGTDRVSAGRTLSVPGFVFALRTALAPLDTGGFVLAWNDALANGDGIDTNLKVELFSATGVSVAASSFSIGATAIPYPDIVALSDGSLLTAWAVKDGYRAQFLTSAGALTAGIFSLPGNDLLALGGGSFAIAGRSATDGDLSVQVAKPVAVVSIGGVIQGTANGDLIVADTTAVSIDGLAGDDFLNGSALDDVLYGAAGNDSLNGGDGADILVGGSGADAFHGGAGIDTASYADTTAGLTVFLAGPQLNSGDAAGDTHDGVENLTGSAYADILGGNDGDNGVGGDGGSDWLFGFGGADALQGGTGNDVLEGGSGADILNGGDGADVASYRNSGAGIVLDMVTPGNSAGDAAGDTLSNIENIWGSAYNDTIRSTISAGGQVYGFEGDDSLAGSSGNDVFYGGAGTDTIVTGSGADDVFYLSWSDHVNVYGTAEPNEGGDTITDFTHGTDRIIVSRYWFGFGNIAGPAAALTSANADFITSGSATSSKPTFFWNDVTKVLQFDPDGTGASTAVTIATLTGATLSLSDIWTA